MKKLSKPLKKPPQEENKTDFSYPASEDIYQQFKQETEIDPTDVSKMKQPNERQGDWNEKGFREDKTGDDLDVPGSELDDEQEKNGSEDEENNYYSIGGDNHDDLEENRGEAQESDQNK